MAMSEISTGYKPEFGLGALYQGMNAANANQASELDLIKQFLANQREQTSQPMDMQILGLKAAQAQQQNTPEMLGKFAQNTEAGYDKAIRENELGNVLHKFKLDAAPAQGQREVDYANIDADIAGMENTLRSGLGDNGLPLGEPLKEDLETRLQELLARRGNTPEHWGKIDTENVKGEWDLKKQRLANQGSANTAAIGANRGANTEALKAAGQIAGMLRNIDSKITSLDTAEGKNAIMEAIFAGGQQPTDALVNSKMREWRQQLQQEKLQYTQQLQALYKEAGLPVTEQPAQPEKQVPNLGATKTINGVTYTRTNRGWESK